MLTSMFAQIMASWPPPSPKIFMFTQVMTSWPPLSHTKFIKKTIGGIRYYKKSNIILRYAFKYPLKGIIPVYRPALFHVYSYICISPVYQWPPIGKTTCSYITDSAIKILSQPQCLLAIHMYGYVCTHSVCDCSQCDYKDKT